MHTAFVPPSEPVTREMILAATKPHSLKRAFRLALFNLGIGRKATGFPFVLWLCRKKER